MKEKIIIDGVDVAGCEHYCEKINTGSGVIQNPLKQGFCLHNITGLQNADIYFRVLTFPKCREQSNCYYKQLKRLEEKYNKMVEISKENLIKYEDLRLDNQKLNLIIDRLLKNSGYPDTVCSAEDFETVYENMQIKQVQLNEYKHALEEIKGTIKHFKTYFSEKELNKVKFSDITVIEEIIAGAIGE